MTFNKFDAMLYEIFNNMRDTRQSWSKVGACDTVAADVDVRLLDQWVETGKADLESVDWLLLSDKARSECTIVAAEDQLTAAAKEMFQKLSAIESRLLSKQSFRLYAYYYATGKEYKDNQCP